jgi:hypothetical protein
VVADDLHWTLTWCTDLARWLVQRCAKEAARSERINIARIIIFVICVNSFLLLSSSLLIAAVNTRLNQRSARFLPL